MTNHRVKSGQKKKGKHVYITWKDLKEKFGSHARQIRENKYKAQAERDPNDPNPPYWAPHEELPDDKDTVLKVYLALIFLRCTCSMFQQQLT